MPAMRCQLLVTALVATQILVQCSTAAAPPPGPDIVRAADVPTPPYRFEPADEALLDEIQRACFLYFWKEVGDPAPLVRDRRKAPVSSVAAVGFQLSALPVGVERGWITRAAGAQRAAAILRALIERPDNKRFGVYLHYPDLNTGGPSDAGYEIVASTIDHALLLAGALTAGAYFGGPVRELAERMEAESNWRAFATAPGGLLSMGWRVHDVRNVAGDGEFLTSHWYVASDEERLIYFLAVGASRTEFALPPERYYALRRVVKAHGDLPPFVVSWPGCLFTYLFSHCWIEYAAFGPDEPARFGGSGPRVDWFENSRRAVLTHRQRCIELASRYATLGPDRWGLSACVGREGYIVPEVRPNLSNEDRWYEGTVAPYVAGTALMLTPAESMAALRAFRALRTEEGHPLIWHDPAVGGYGLADAFNLTQKYVCDDVVGIDHGPMLLGIENARTGLIWRLFMQTPTAQRAVERLGWTRAAATQPASAPATTAPRPAP